MKKVIIIIKREYLTRIRTKAFLLGTIASPLLLLSFILLPAFFATRTGGERQLTVLDQSGNPALYETISKKLESSDGGEQDAGNRRVGTRFILTRKVVSPDEDIDRLRSEYSQGIEKNSDNAYVVLRPGILDGEEPEYYSKSVSDFAIRDIERAISAAIIQQKMVRAGADPSTVSEYLKQVNMKTIKVGPEGESQESGSQIFQVAFVMLFFIYVTVLAYGISVMRGVIEEKQSRIVEVIVSSVKPAQMMLGKLIGIGMVGLTQYVIWILVVMMIPLFGASLLASSDFNFPKLPLGLLIYFIVYFVLGYFLYATLYAMVGAIVSSEEEGQQAQFPITMLIVIPMILFTLVMKNPDSPLSVVLSLVPFFSPTLMIMRIVIATPPLWQILLSMFLMAAAILGAVWLAARIYRVGILMYGKRPSIAELGRWLRYT